MKKILLTLLITFPSVLFGNEKENIVIPLSNVLSMTKGEHNVEVFLQL
jgi:hypothetical protein